MGERVFAIFEEDEAGRLDERKVNNIKDKDYSNSVVNFSSAWDLIYY